MWFSESGLGGLPFKDRTGAMKPLLCQVYIVKQENYFCKIALAVICKLNAQKHKSLELFDWRFNAIFSLHFSGKDTVSRWWRNNRRSRVAGRPHLLQLLCTRLEIESLQRKSLHWQLPVTKRWTTRIQLGAITSPWRHIRWKMSHLRQRHVSFS